MSKPIARLAFFVLISLVLIAATTASVRGWLGSTMSDRASVQVHEVSGLQTDLNHYRSSTAELQSLQLQMDAQSLNQSTGHGGCHSDQHNVPQD